MDKLLIGFDAPVNTILYITRTLKDRTLLQAIARVTRLYAVLIVKLPENKIDNLFDSFFF